MTVRFFPGLHQPSDAQHFERCCIAVHRIEKRVKPLGCGEVFVDSGAFTTIDRHRGYPEPVHAYAKKIWRIHTEDVAEICAAVAQDYMCEQFVVAKLLGIEPRALTPEMHRRQVSVNQELTIVRYDELLQSMDHLSRGWIPFDLIPVLQGYHPEEYVRHIRSYGDRLKEGMWVGVGSVCKRNGSVADIINVLSAIREVRPDLRLHGFGLKLTALKNPSVRAMLYSADSMAWSHHAYHQFIDQRIALQNELGRKLTDAEAKVLLRERGIHPRSANDWREAKRFLTEVETVTDRTETAWQMSLPFSMDAVA